MNVPCKRTATFSRVGPGLLPQAGTIVRSVSSLFGRFQGHFLHANLIGILHRSRRRRRRWRRNRGSGGGSLGRWRHRWFRRRRRRRGRRSSWRRRRRCRRGTATTTGFGHNFFLGHVIDAIDFGLESDNVGLQDGNVGQGRVNARLQRRGRGLFIEQIEIGHAKVLFARFNLMFLEFDFGQFIGRLSESKALGKRVLAHAAHVLKDRFFLFLRHGVNCGIAYTLDGKGINLTLETWLYRGLEMVKMRLLDLPTRWYSSACVFLSSAPTELGTIQMRTLRAQSLCFTQKSAQPILSRPKFRNIATGLKIFS
jgi:hypothetical protein